MNHTESVPHLFPAGWWPLAPLADIGDRRLEHHVVEQTSLLVFRRGEDINVLSDVCSHLSAPLHEGKVVDDTDASGGSSQCVECPWRQSAFSLHSGEVVHGPATSGQPRFSTRITDGMVEVCLPGAG